jgi:hypothetical protein
MPVLTDSRMVCLGCFLKELKNAFPGPRATKIAPLTRLRQARRS